MREREDDGRVRGGMSGRWERREGERGEMVEAEVESEGERAGAGRVWEGERG